MPMARHRIVRIEQEGVYHCISRCVRRCFLCGVDPLTGKSFEHRRAWIEERLKVLTRLFEFSIFSYAVMSNHVHLVIKTSPHKARKWSSEKIAKKAYSLCPGAVSQRFGAGEPYAVVIRRASLDLEFVELWRGRLMDLSWFMRFLNEHVARRANREESIRGRFWEGRFRCSLLADRGAILSCMAYVDLNPVRAGIGERPEDCPYTSIFRRIAARQARQRYRLLKISGRNHSNQEWSRLIRTSQSDSWLCPVDQVFGPEIFSKSEFCEDNYLKLVDLAGRALVPGKAGSIPEDLNPILERLDLEPRHWIPTVKRFGSLYWRVAGRADRLAQIALQVGQRWFRSSRETRVVYLKV